MEECVGSRKCRGTGRLCASPAADVTHGHWPAALGLRTLTPTVLELSSPAQHCRADVRVPASEAPGDGRVSHQVLGLPASLGPRPHPHLPASIIIPPPAYVRFPQFLSEKTLVMTFKAHPAKEGPSRI